jgi:hypothetical protein
MAHCEFLAECQYFSDQIEKVQAIGATFRSNQTERILALSKTFRLEFCASNASYCARHMVAKALGSAKVPGDLHPSHVLRAKQILEKPQSATVDTRPAPRKP